ncbi:SRPBCC family protein [Propionivibrio sp.]|uniref:SRPBCC family protein n=1 Tax=Propionivibrio sp. TaxID=2212460 RepID=UPI0026164083|nr:SRPBCC family protein [Propionivibrio sp.]
MSSLPRLAASILLILSCAAFGADPEIVVKLLKNGDAFVVDARFDIAAPLRTAWEVLTDFDNMAGILSNLTSSKIIRRTGNTLNVVQEGAARYGIFTYSFASEREIRLEPMRRILARQLTGTAKRFESEMKLSASDRGTQIHYRAEIVPDSGIARTFGGPFIEHEIEEQLNAMAAEMVRRKAL